MSLRVVVAVWAALSVLLLSASFSAGQTNLLINGNFESSFGVVNATNGWIAPQGTSDTGAGNSGSLRRYGALYTSTPPNAFCYDGSYSLLYESGTLNQSVQQTVSITGGHQYLLSFYVMFTDADLSAYFAVTYQHNTESSATTLLTPATFSSGSAGTSQPFWWSQFVYTINSPSAANSLTLTFLGSDDEYGFLLDSITLYDAGVSGNSPTATAPPAPPALTPNPSNNILVNGDFESGSLAPWRGLSGDNPYPLSGGEGAYDFNGYSGHTGISCPQGNYCFTFGAPYFSLPIQQTVNNISPANNYTLSFMWYTPGGYNASQASDSGSAFLFSWGWNSNSLSTAFSQYNNTAATSPATVTVQLGTPPSGTTSLTLRYDGYFYQTEYVLDYVVLTAATSSAPNSPNAAAAGSASSGLMAGALAVGALVSALVL